MQVPEAVEKFKWRRLFTAMTAHFGEVGLLQNNAMRMAEPPENIQALFRSVSNWKKRGAFNEVIASNKHSGPTWSLIGQWPNVFLNARKQKMIESLSFVGRMTGMSLRKTAGYKISASKWAFNKKTIHINS